MLEAPSYLKDKDVSYLDDDGAPELATTQKCAVKGLQEWMDPRRRRGTKLNRQ